MQKTIRAGLIIALFLSALVSISQTSHGADEPKTPEAPKPAVDATTVTATDGTLRMSVHYKTVATGVVLREIAQKGNLDVIVVGDLNQTIETVHLDNIAPAAALEQFCQYAGLEYKIVDQTYIVRDLKPGTAQEPPAVISTEFAETKLLQILDLLAHTTNYRILRDDPAIDDIPIQYLRITNARPETAILKIVAAAALEYRKEGENTFILSLKK